MTRQVRKAYLVYVDLDPNPGPMHSQESAQHALRNVILQSPTHRNVLVSLAPGEVQSLVTPRKGFLVYTYVDVFPGVLGVDGTAVESMRDVLTSQLSYCNPSVFLAPGDLQPSYLEGVDVA